jgi:hypothetical protein
MLPACAYSSLLNRKSSLGDEVSPESKEEFREWIEGICVNSCHLLRESFVYYFYILQIMRYFSVFPIIMDTYRIASHSFRMIVLENAVLNKSMDSLNKEVENKIKLPFEKAHQKKSSFVGFMELIKKLKKKNPQFLNSMQKLNLRQRAFDTRIDPTVWILIIFHPISFFSFFFFVYFLA